PKRERLRLEKQFNRMQRAFGGISTLERPPGMLFVIDVKLEDIAVREANRTKTPIVAMCDTDADPTLIDFPIPANDDAIRAIQLVTARVADAVLEGRAFGEVEQEAAAAGSVAMMPPTEGAAPAEAAPAAEAAAAAAPTAPAQNGAAEAEAASEATEQ
ncbi:MAG: 30S ribosomal protein S2, partial [Chloroflexi bacterium]|nr:30S ribosomal protein S2 [Chloroflexota bacterium]